MMQNYGSTAKLLSDVELLNQVFYLCSLSPFLQGCCTLLLVIQYWNMNKKSEDKEEREIKGTKKEEIEQCMHL